MSKFVIIDVETRSEIDLRKVGAWRYATHPSTDVWCVCAAYAFDGAPVQLWVRGEPVPEALIAAAADLDTLWVAHNANFERTHILTPRYGWPEIPVECWRCTMAASLALALPGALDKVAKVAPTPSLTETWLPRAAHIAASAGRLVMMVANG
jgi:DNA polymerase